MLELPLAAVEITGRHGLVNQTFRTKWVGNDAEVMLEQMEKIRRKATETVTQSDEN
jgi:hypothetical protein